MNQPKTTMRTIKNLYKAEYSKIEDLITYRALPTRSVDMTRLEPFIFLNHHGPQVYPPDNRGLPFGPHPHKGFETVTFIIDGDILHKDTEGHESVITSGGIQWMTAGRGIIHSEVSSEEFKAQGGKVEILQLWINLPSRLKQTTPGYIGLQKEDIPHLSEDQGKVTIDLISGAWKGAQGPVQSLSDVFMSTIRFARGGSLTVPADSSRTIFLYVVKGKILSANETLPALHLAEFNRDGESFTMEAQEESIVIFGHARPNNEPVVAHGPFVMNTQQEIQEAYMEYYEGKFGDMD